VKVTHKSFKVKTKNIEITTLGSNYHIEMNPSDVGLSINSDYCHLQSSLSGMNDRLIVQEVIKEIAQTQSVNVASQLRPFKGSHN